MADEVLVRVRLDTKQAKAELDVLRKEGKKTGEEVGRGLRGTLSAGLRATGAGAAFGVGLQAVQSATRGGVGDILGESFGLWSAKLADWTLGDLAVDARATVRAREEVSQTFAYVSGVRDGIPPQARAIFEQIKTVRLHQEKGLMMFQMDEAMRGPGLEEASNKIADRLATALKDGLRDFFSSINPF